MPSDVKTNRIIHVGVLKKGNKKHYFFLKEMSSMLYKWEDEESPYKDLQIYGQTIEEAISEAKKFFKDQEFYFLNCGFRYTLPERDEHGINALFFQMKDSYNASNGVYFDEILGNNCYVQFASLEALNLLRKLQLEPRL